MTLCHTQIQWCVHYDEGARRPERYRVLRSVDGQEFGGSWITVTSFGTEREARACGMGFIKGFQFADQGES